MLFLRPGLSWRDRHAAARAALEAEQDRRDILGVDLDRDGLRGALRGEGEDGTGGLPADRDERRELGHDGFEPAAGEERREVQPVAPDVADGPQRPTLVLLEAPVPVRVEQEPVLEVAAGDEADVPHPAVPHVLRDVLVERVEPDVEVHRVHEARRRGLRDERRRFLRRHRERLLADDVLPGAEDRRCLLVVELVGRRDMDDLDGVVGEDGLEAVVRLREAQLLGPLRATFRGTHRGARRSSRRCGGAPRCGRCR